MKKIIKIIVCAAVALAVMLGACACGSEARERTGSIDVSYYVDQKTGVNYVLYTAGGGITPRLNTDGSLYVTEEGEINE